MWQSMPEARGRDSCGRFLNLPSESKLSYCRARYYDSVTSRFLSEEPKGFNSGLNFYAYTENSPTNATDPSGLDCRTVIIIVICQDQGEPPTILAAEKAHEAQHVRDRLATLVSVGLVGLVVSSRMRGTCEALEARGYAKEIPILQNRINELKKKKCLTDGEKKELDLLEAELSTAIAVSTSPVFA